MKVAFLEDPACSWCWAFQPIETAFLFEYGHEIHPRRIMGGLRDHPLPDISFAIRHWSVARKISGMPFDTSIWDDHVLRTTHLACLAVKALQIAQHRRVDAFLRRLREAFYVEHTAIDDLETISALATDVGVDAVKMRATMNGGRASSLFQIDQRIAAETGFGFPTVVIRPTGAPASESILLQGLVPYGELIGAMADAGFSLRRRRRFQDRPEDWKRLYQLRHRVSCAELKLLCGLDERALESRVDESRLLRDGVFYVPGPAMLEPSTVPFELAEVMNSLG